MKRLIVWVLVYIALLAILNIPTIAGSESGKELVHSVLEFSAVIMIANRIEEWIFKKDNEVSTHD